MALVPISANAPHTISGNEIRLYSGGAEVELEIQVSGWDPDCAVTCDGSPAMAGYQARINSAGYLGVNAAPANPGVNLTPKGFPGAPGDGAWIVTNICSTSGRNCSSGQPPCAGAEGFCIPNSNFALSCCSPLMANDFSTLNYIFGALTLSGAQADDGSSRHAGTLILEIPAGAEGVYTVHIDSNDGQTFLLDTDTIPILPLVRVPAVIRIEACANNAECDDGIFCNGDELCAAGECLPGSAPCSGTAPLCDEPNMLCTCAEASGELEDCNANGIHDECDILTATSPDCNVNTVPDECETGCVSASASNLLPGAPVMLNPGGGNPDPTTEALVEFTNITGGAGASITVNETTDPVHPSSGGYQVMGTTLIVDTNLTNGQFTMRLAIPFTLADLGGADPLSPVLLWYDPSISTWVPAASGNTVNSPGHPGPLGDNFTSSAPFTPAWASMSSDLGDYGVFWNTSSQFGFAWANIDHASEFALGVLVLSPPTPAPNDVAKNRYISFAPGDTGPGVAFLVDKVTSPSGSCWVAAPNANGNALCVSSPIFRNWTESVVHVGDCEIVPVANYEIRATTDGTAFSGPLGVSTIPLPALNGKAWGDVAGVNSGSQWTPPNQLTNVNDILAVLAFITNAATKPSFQQANLQAISSTDPCLNAFVNTADVLILVKAVAGDAYPFTANPAACPVCP